MPVCHAAAHCSVPAAHACLPSSGFWVPGANLGVFGAANYFTSAIAAFAWSSTAGGPAEEVQATGQAGPGAESFGEKMMRFVHPIHEPFTPAQFMGKALDFLSSIGVVHIASLEVDGASVYTVSEGGVSDSSLPDLVKEKATEYFNSHAGPVREIDMRVFGRSDYFFLDLVLTYRPVHSPHEQGIYLAVGARPVELHLLDGETTEQYSERMVALKSDIQKLKAFRDEVREKGRELTDDLSHHMAETFEGARFRVMEFDESSESL